MASKKRMRPVTNKAKSNPLAQLGLFDIPNFDAMDDSDEDIEADDNDLESELEAILSGKTPSRPKPKIAKPALDIEKQIALCLKDDEEEENDENLSGDEDLLSELKTLTADSSDGDSFAKTDSNNSEQNAPAESSLSVIRTLNERKELYTSAAAAAANDVSKSRRYKRALKTIDDLLKTAKSGGAINEDDIPPIVKVTANVLPKKKTEEEGATSTLTSPSPQILDLSSLEQNIPSNLPEASSTVNDTLLEETSTSPPESSVQTLTQRRNQYKVAALEAKRAGNREMALNYLKTVKTFDSVLTAINNKQPIDLSNIPPAPPGFEEKRILSPANENSPVVEAHQTSGLEQAALIAANESDGSELFSVPSAPKTVLEALQQRLEKYHSTKRAAEAENNSSKARRLQRIIKLYEGAIKDHKAGKKVDFEELPTPPGFPSIPSTDNHTSPAPTSKSPTTSTTTVPKPSPKPASAVETQEPKIPTAAAKKTKIQRVNTLGNRQLEFLLERQKMFRQAALSSKQNGDIQQAKEYLRMSKGFDSMIEATKCGLPIDTASIPTPPQLESDFEIIEMAECIENPYQSAEATFCVIEKDLTQQIEICKRNKEHFMRLGDVTSASKFEKLCLESNKDLAVVLNLKRKELPAPKFHYEIRLFSIVQCNSDLSDNDFEVTIERGINMPGKPNPNTYVRVEFPIPPETPQKGKTHTVSESNNPVFQEEVFKFDFPRKSRSTLRHFKRQALKVEVWSKGGFLKSDTLLGTVLVKLSDLESKCCIHDSFNLMDGRKSCGGKIELKIRIREPLLVKQVEEVKEKWLVLDT